MNEQNLFETHLSTYLNNLVYNRMIMAFHSHPGHALGGEFVRRNAFYAKVLTHLIRREEPTFGSFVDIDESEDPEVVFQNGLYLYNKWASLGLSGAVYNYCQLMNRLISRTVLCNAKGERLELPDLCDDAYKIENFINKINTHVHAKTPNGKTLKRKFENLAVNA